MSYTAKNYMAEGGDKLVIGGELEILENAIVKGGATAENQAASTATDVAGLKADFNALLTKLKAAGLMAADAE